MARNDDYISIGMGLDIEDLRTGLSDAKREMSLAESEFKAATAGLDRWDQSIEGVTAKLKQMGKEMEAKGKIVAAYKTELERVTKAYGENSSKADEIRTKLNNAEAAYTKAARYTEDLKDRLEELKREQGEVSEGSDTLKDRLSNVATSASNAVSGGLSRLKDHLTDMAKNAVMKLVEGLKEFARQVIEAGKQYTSTMSEVRAISGAGVEEFQKLQEAARTAGETTIYTANEAAEALKYMALAGWDADESASALGGVLDLAAASGMELAQASDVVTDYLTAFGLEAQDAAKFADLLAYAQGNSNTSVSQLAEAYKGCAAVMSASGQTVETTTALLAKMADAGTKGSSAGTGLAAVMRDMTKKMEDGAIKIGDVSVKVTDADGNFRSLTDILLDVEKATDGMGDAQKQSALMTTFTSESVKALSLILNQGASSVAGFEEELRGSSGTAKEMSDIMNDNLAGDMKKMEARMTELKLRLFELIEGPLRGLIQIITDVVPKVIEFGESVYNFFVDAYNATKPLWDALGAWFGDIWQKIEEFARNVGVIVDAIKEAWGVLVGWFSNLGDSIETFMTDPWGNIQRAFQDGARAIVAPFEGIGRYFGGVWDSIKGAFSGAGTWFSNLSSDMKRLLTAGWDTISSTFSNAWSSIKGAFSGASSWFSDLSSNMRSMLTSGWQTVERFFAGVWNDIKGAFSGVIGWFSSTFGGAWSAVEGAFKPVYDFFMGIYNTIKGIFQPIVSFFSNLFGGSTGGKGEDVSTAGAVGAIKSPFDVLSGFFSGIKSAILSPFSTITTTFSGIFGRAVGAIKSAFEGVIGWFNENILDPLTKGVEEAIGEASNLGGGLVEGVVQGKQDVVAGSTTIGEIITNSLMDYFGIHSPSTLMRDLIGKNIDAGIAEGIADASSMAVGEVERLSQGLTQAFDPSLRMDTSGIRLSGAYAQANQPQTVVYNQTINSPEPLSPGEIYRDTKSLIGRRLTA